MPPRTRRYRADELEELKRDVRAECVRRVEKLAGAGYWTTERETMLRGAIGFDGKDPPADIAAAAVYAELRATLEIAADLLREDPRGWHAERLRAVVPAALADMPADDDNERKGRWSIVAVLDQPGMLWWSDRPDALMLAAVSLLLGSWPRDIAAKRPSVADVIREEKKALVALRKKYERG